MNQLRPSVSTGVAMRVVTSCSGRFHVFDQARELARHGMLHRLITAYPRYYPARFGVPADRVLPLLWLSLLCHGVGRIAGRLSPVFRDRHTHLVHALFSRQLARVLPEDTEFFVGLSSFCLEALDRCRELGIPCAVDHGSFHQSEERRLILEEGSRWGVASPQVCPDWIIEKEAAEFSGADHVFALSNAARDSLVRNGVPASKIFVNPCGVDLSAFSPGQQEDGVFRVIQVGGIRLGKGTLDLLEAFALARIPGAELQFVGGGLESSGLTGLIERLRAPGVRFIKPVLQSRLPDFYVQCSVFVLASLADGFGMVVPQAMACGLPVIVTENVGARDLVEDGVNGFVVPVRAPAAIAEKLRLLHKHPELRARMGRAARRSVESGFSWVHYGDRLAHFLNGLRAS